MKDHEGERIRGLVTRRANGLEETGKRFDDTELWSFAASSVRELLGHPSDQIRGLAERWIVDIEAMAAERTRHSDEEHRYRLAASALGGLLREIDAGISPDDTESLKALFADD